MHFATPLTRGCEAREDDAFDGMPECCQPSERVPVRRADDEKSRASGE